MTKTTVTRPDGSEATLTHYTFEDLDALLKELLCKKPEAVKKHVVVAKPSKGGRLRSTSRRQDLKQASNRAA